MKCWPNILPLACHQHLKWSQASVYPWYNSTRVWVFSYCTCLVSSCMRQGITTHYVCLIKIWRSWTAFVTLCGGSSVPDHLVGTLFFSQCVPWICDQRPGGMLSLPNALVTTEVHFTGILSWKTLTLLAQCNQGVLLNSCATFPCAQWVPCKF